MVPGLWHDRGDLHHHGAPHPPCHHALLRQQQLVQSSLSQWNGERLLLFITFRLIKQANEAFPRIQFKIQVKSYEQKTYLFKFRLLKNSKLSD